jgi:hypothetical protein
MLEAVYPRALWRCKASQHPVPEASNLLCWLISESQFRLTTPPVPTVWARWLAGVGGTIWQYDNNRIFFDWFKYHFDFATGDQAITMSLIPGKCNAMKLTSQMCPLCWWMLLQKVLWQDLMHNKVWVLFHLDRYLCFQLCSTKCNVGIPYSFEGLFQPVYSSWEYESIAALWTCGDNGVRIASPFYICC